MISVLRVGGLCSCMCIFGALGKLMFMIVVWLVVDWRVYVLQLVARTVISLLVS